MNDLENLQNLNLAHYILKATALIGVERKVGGNQFRHAFATLGILLDYKFYDKSILLKASLLHDLFEDLPEPGTRENEINGFEDVESHEVTKLVWEVTRQDNETKREYLQRVLDKGSENALLLKCADRISNLTDLHRDTHSVSKISKYLDQTEEFVIPMARKVNHGMERELKDLVANRRSKIRGIDTNKISL